MSLDYTGIPYPTRTERWVWEDTYKAMRDAGERHQATAKKWYAERGKVAPSEPGAGLVEVARRMATG